MVSSAGEPLVVASIYRYVNRSYPVLLTKCAACVSESADSSKTVQATLVRVVGQFERTGPKGLKARGGLAEFDVRPEARTLQAEARTLQA